MVQPPLQVSCSNNCFSLQGFLPTVPLRFVETHIRLKVDEQDPLLELKEQVLREHCKNADSLLDAADRNIVEVMAQFVPTTVYIRAQIIAESRAALLGNAEFVKQWCAKTAGTVLFADDAESRARNLRAFALIRSAMEDELNRFPSDTTDAQLLASNTISDNMRNVVTFRSLSRQVLQHLIALFDTRALPPVSPKKTGRSA